jgi:hypothetical protein
MRGGIQRAFLNLLDALASLGAVLGGILIWSAFSSTSASAPQQGALAAIGIGFGAIPYFLAGVAHRAFVRDDLIRRDRRSERTDG